MADMINAIYTIRSAVASDDASNPSTAQGAFDPSEYGVECLAVDVVVSGTNVQWKVTPLYWSRTAAAYVEGIPMVCDRNWRFITRADGCTDFYVRCDNSSGTSPVVSVYVSPVPVR